MNLEMMDQATTSTPEMAAAMEAGPELATKRLEQCIPVDTVSVPDEGEQLAAPEPGDTVRYEVEGKVSRVEGGHAYVDPTMINGQAVDAPAGEATDELASMSEEAEGLGY